jgi:predicted O-methyltransferase YrrM
MDEVLLDIAYMGGRIRFANLSHHDNDAYVSFLRTGRPLLRSEHNRALLDVIGESTSADAAMIVDEVLPQVPRVLRRLDAGGALLEIGSGTGAPLVRYAARFPGARIVGLEYDEPAVGIARKTVVDADLAGRIEVRHGDANRLSDHESYDLVAMNLVLHETGGPDEQVNVLRRLWAALRPGGAVIVSELPYPDDDHAYRTEPVYQQLAGLMLHEALVGCSSITQHQLLRLAQDSGFSRVRVAAQSRPSRWVVVGERLLAEPSLNA